ncbi:MAG: hydratase [Oscillospiraceae bacterium]
MIKPTASKVTIKGGVPVPGEGDRERTLAYTILRAHETARGEKRMSLRFDSLISHDITYVGVIQTAMASGMTRFPVPYVLTNCHNSLCAVGGTINEDDHAFGLSACVKFGGIYVPANMAVIHQYAREVMSGCGRMILGSDSHTRYGALGTMGFGEGGPEIVRQLLSDGYDLVPPEVVLVWLKGSPSHGVGPHDVALALCAAVYQSGFVKNKILEFGGPGVEKLPMDFRIGIDVMSTETACLSSIWTTDEAVEEYYVTHNRAGDYKAMQLAEGAGYDAVIEIDLSKIEPMAALPFHPSKAYTIRELCANAGDILRSCEREAAEKDMTLSLCDKLKNGRLATEQGIIAGCAGGMFDNVAAAAAILSGGSIGNGGFSLSVYPPSVPVELELMASGASRTLLEAGALMKPCFCGPCFGAGETPANGALSVRHTTRNFPSREGARPAEGQSAGVILMDARSIAATALNGGIVTSAAEVDYVEPLAARREFSAGVYEKRVYNGLGKPEPDAELRFGPNIIPWPEIPALPENLLLHVCSVIDDPVTTTDELIPSGETSSYRSNPLRLAEFTLSRRDPGYVARAKAAARTSEAQCAEILAKFGCEVDITQTGVGSVIYANMPGDGSAREQAASCQRVLGGSANICREFATKRYRSNCVNWGMLPLRLGQGADFGLEVGDVILLPAVRSAISAGAESISALALHGDKIVNITYSIAGLSAGEREIILDGCMMNWYRRRGK